MDKRLYLDPAGHYPIMELTDVPLVRVPLVEHTPMPFVKKRMIVAAGALIATHASPNIGDLHAPFTGTVKDVTTTYIEIEALAEEPESATNSEATAENAPETSPAKNKTGGRYDQAPVSFDGLNREELAVILKSLGISVRLFSRHAKTLVVNALNPEPGMLYTQELLASRRSTLEAGLQLLKRLSIAEEYVLALPTGSPHMLTGLTPLLPETSLPHKPDTPPGTQAYRKRIHR